MLSERGGFSARVEVGDRVEVGVGVRAPLDADEAPALNSSRSPSQIEPTQTERQSFGLRPRTCQQGSVQLMAVGYFRPAERVNQPAVSAACSLLVIFTPSTGAIV